MVWFHRKNLCYSVWMDILNMFHIHSNVRRLTHIVYNTMAFKSNRKGYYLLFEKFRNHYVRTTLYLISSYMLITRLNLTYINKSESNVWLSVCCLFTPKLLN